MAVADDPIASLLNQTGQLVSLPAVAMEVLRLTKDSQVDAAQLKRCIQTDPALTGKLLRVVNSSLFGLSREVSDLNQALAFLGTKPLKLLVLGFSIPHRLFDGLGEEMLRYFWQRSLTKAVAARQLAQRRGMGGDEPFIVGLLSQIGMLALLQQLGEPYAALIEQVREQRGDITSWERHALGFTHIEFTERLLTEWKLPEETVAAINRDSKPNSRLTPIVHQAELLTRLLVDQRPDAMTVLATESTGADSCQEMSELVAEVEVQVAQLASIFNVSLGELEYVPLVTEAHQRLSLLAEDFVSEAIRGRASEAAKRKLKDDSRALRTPSGHHLDRAGSNVDHCTQQSDLLTMASATAHLATDDLRPVQGAQRKESQSLEVDDPAFEGLISQAVDRCRQDRTELSLLVIEASEWGEVVFQLGREGAELVLRAIEAGATSLEHPDAHCIRVRDPRYAVIFPDCDRMQAARFGQQMLRILPNLLRAEIGPSAQLNFSVGVATLTVPSKNFPPGDLVAAANRCLDGAKMAGGNCVKSIAVY